MSNQYGIGASLESMGLESKKEGMQALAKAADEETDRNAKNTQIQAADKAGKQQLGATLGALGGFALGAQTGMVAGPMGALIGGAIGAVAGGLF